LETDREFLNLVSAAEAGDTRAADQLFSLLYGELHRLAEHTLRRGSGTSTLRATTLLHEAYLNISSRTELAFPDRARFLAYASRAMRGLVIDYARRRCAQKRGRQFEITLREEASGPEQVLGSAEDLERLHDALDELGKLEPALAQLVDLHFFCGYTFAEIAGLRDVSERTIQRDWRKARLLLYERCNTAID